MLVGERGVGAMAGGARVVADGCDAAARGDQSVWGGRRAGGRQSGNANEPRSVSSNNVVKLEKRTKKVASSFHDLHALIDL